MNLNKYTLFFALLFGTFALNAQQAKVFFDTNVDCLNNQYCATVKIEAINETEYEVGTSSILMQYNKDALTFASYTSHNFDKTSTCELGNENISLYDEHAYDALVPGLLNTTMTLTIPGYGCPTVSKDAVDVATVCFDIKEMGANSGLRFHNRHTNFNKGGVADVQIIESLDMIHAQETIECENGEHGVAADISGSVVQGLEVSPNPFTDVIYLDINTESSDDLNIQLYDVKGRLMKNINENVFVGNNNFSLEAADVPSGVYLLEIKGADFETSIKLLKN